MGSRCHFYTQRNICLVYRHFPRSIVCLIDIHFESAHIVLRYNVDQPGNQNRNHMMYSHLIEHNSVSKDYQPIHFHMHIVVRDQLLYREHFHHKHH